MKLGILIRDTEYRKALVDKLASYDNDIFVNVIGETGGDTSDCLILTDIGPEEFDEKILSRIAMRTVFLSGSADDADAASDSDTYRRVFKYSGVESLLSEFVNAYSEWHGGGVRRTCSSKTIAVLSDSDSFASDKCRALARQIIYRRGGRVLLLSLGFINDYGRPESGRINRFARLMYAVRTGRGSAWDSFTYTDSYGVSSLMLPPGLNPAAYLEEDELRELIAGLSGGFDAVVMDTGTCLRQENLSVIKEAGGIVCFESGRRIPGFSEMIGRESGRDVISIRHTGESDEALAIDDCIRQIYGMDGYDNNKSSDSKQIRN